MKTYNEFISEAAPLLALPALASAGALAKLKMLVGAGLAGYGAYQTGKSLQKGDMTGAGLNALMTVNPLGRVGALAGLADMFRPKGEQGKPETQQQKPKSGMSDAELKAAQDKINKARASGQMSNLPADYKQQELDAGAAAERSRPGAGLPKSGTGTNLSPTPTPTTQPPKPSLAMRGSQTGTVDSTGKFTARPFTSAEKKSFEASRANTPGMNKTKPTSTVAKSDFKMPSFKAALNMPSFQSTLKTPIKPAQDAQARQAGQSAQRLQQRMRQMRNTPAALAKRL